MPVLAASGLAVIFGNEVLFENLTFTVEAGDRWGIIGRNGSGKSTLMQLITGARNPDRGSLAREPRLRISLMDQYRDFGSANTVWEAAALGFAELFELERELARQAEAMGNAGDGVTEAMLGRYASDFEQFEHLGGYTASARVDAVLAGLDFDPVEARTRELSGLSGGERGRLALAGQLAAPADLLILDEPTNHLDLGTTRWLGEYLRGIDETVLLISHDRAFLNAVTNHTLHLEAGTGFAWDCGYAESLIRREERRRSEQRAYQKQQARISAEEDYIARNIAGNNSAQAKGRRRRLDRLPRLSAPAGEEGVMSVVFHVGERGGDQVLVADQLAVQVGERVLLQPWSGTLRRGDVVGLIGPNGAGKTTLLKSLLGERSASGGSVRLMPSTRVAYYRQDLGNVDTGSSLYDLISHRRPLWTRGQIQGHLGRFGFSGDSVLRRAATLSGGERARMALALIMLEEANLLVFDEPTNHLDVESIEVLEDAIEGYEGTVLLVSHDQALLENLTTRIWALEDAVLHDYPGSFSEYELDAAARRSRAEARAAEVAVRRNTPKPAGQQSTNSGRERDQALRRAERALEEAELEVVRLEREVARLEAELADPLIYQNGNELGRVDALIQALTLERSSLVRAMEEWELATARFEELGAGPK